MVRRIGFGKPLPPKAVPSARPAMSRPMPVARKIAEDNARTVAQVQANGKVLKEPPARVGVRRTSRSGWFLRLVILGIFGFLLWRFSQEPAGPVLPDIDLPDIGLTVPGPDAPAETPADAPVEIRVPEPGTDRPAEVPAPPARPVIPRLTGPDRDAPQPSKGGGAPRN